MIAFVAAAGYKVVARVANYAAPWMVLVFMAFGLVGLRDFMTETNTTVTGFGDVWELDLSSLIKPGEELELEYTSEECPATACTNHYHQRRIQKFAFTWFSSKLRYGKIARKIAAGHKWDVQSIKDVLQATGIPPINIQRTIMRPEELSLEVSFKNNNRGPGEWVKLPKDLLFPERSLAPSETHELAHTGA